MTNRISKIATSIKHLGEIEVNEWDFMDLLNRDISDLEISRSLRRLGSTRVMEWDFRDVLPAVNRLAHKEVDIVDVLRRTANYRVMEWDFRKSAQPQTQPRRALTPEETQALIVRLKDYLQYVTANLIDEPGHAQIKVREIAPGVFRFRLVMVQRDVAMLVGRGGQTAAAIRNILKAAAAWHGAHALLRIVTHAEDARAADGEP
jgi:hypothetical protein